MMEAMIEPIYICSSDFRIEYMNPAMIRRTGRDATGEHCFKALHGLEEKCPWCMHDKAQQGEYLEFKIVSPKDNRSYHISQTPVTHGDGSVLKLTVFRDITEMREMEAQLQQAQKMEAIGTLAGGIAHDFNNILGAVIILSELSLLETPEGSSLHAHIGKILEAGMRAKDLVKQILAFSRQREHDSIPMSLSPIINEALKFLRSSLSSTIKGC
ncbi:MAG: PAS domain-containing protein [Nitrospina sp.]|jgi:signal transduction histidine kinase|nr:PAS domain-containing protein [Nitrospina sp.]